MLQRIRENCLFFQNLILDDKKLDKELCASVENEEQEDTGTRKLFFRIIEYKNLFIHFSALKRRRRRSEFNESFDK